MKAKARNKLRKKTKWVYSDTNIVEVNANFGEIIDYGFSCKTCLVRSMCIIKSKQHSVMFHINSVSKCKQLKEFLNQTKITFPKTYFMPGSKVKI
jgi:hypothetical protein